MFGTLRRLLTVVVVVTAALSVGLSSPPAGGVAAMCQGEVATIVGTSASETINGTAADDVIAALDGDDTVHGLGGNDVICGESGADSLFGDEGEVDLIAGGTGNDNLDGGFGDADAAVYVDATGSVDANLSSGLAFGQGTDTFAATEGLVGSTFDDRLTGDDEPFNYFVGVPGNDAIDGRGGFNAVFFTFATGPVTVDLRQEVASGEGTDTLTSIQAVSGSPFGDRLIGDTQANIFQGDTGADTIRAGGGDDVFSGDAGNDLLMGGRGNDQMIGGPGEDHFDGGAGTDPVNYRGSAQSVAASLRKGRAKGEGTDSITAAELLVGSAFADSLIGDAGNNRMAGGGGNDSLRGLRGNDLLVGQAGIDTGKGGAGEDDCDTESRRHCENVSSDPTTSSAPKAPSMGAPPAPSGRPPSGATVGTATALQSPSTFLGTIRRTLGGDTAAAAADVTFVVPAVELYPPRCIQATHRTNIDATRRAFGTHYTLSLWYWDEQQRVWRFTGVAIGPMSVGFIAYGLPVDNPYVWYFDSDGQVASGEWSVNPVRQSHYFAWAQQNADGLQLQFVGTHENIESTGYVAYRPWCYLP